MNQVKIQGIILMIIAIILFSLGFAYTFTSEKIISNVHQIGPSGECIHPPDTSCPISEIHRLSTFKHIGLGIVICILLGGLFLFFKKEATSSKPVRKKDIKDLSADEKRVLDALTKAENFMFQNELSEQLSLSRVQVTRLLDKLEGKRLIERRRRGMTNAVFLK